MDYPTAWAYLQQHTDPREHDPRCSWVRASMLCDCHVMNAEYERRKVAILFSKTTGA